MLTRIVIRWCVNLFIEIPIQRFSYNDTIGNAFPLEVLNGKLMSLSLNADLVYLATRLELVWFHKMWFVPFFFGMQKSIQYKSITLYIILRRWLLAISVSLLYNSLALVTSHLRHEIIDPASACIYVKGIYEWNFSTTGLFSFKIVFINLLISIYLFTSVK